ncbi:MAG TPA: alpha/beta hydrolase-fold protein [Longimicrobiales bacterium]
MKRGGSVVTALLIAFGMSAPLGAQTGATRAESIAIGETFTIESRILGETRRINVYRAPAWDEREGAARPVLYMPDGGIEEDFLHIAGLLQISTLNGTMRPFLLVGIENTQRRRDMTGPTTVASDREIAPVVGGSAAFRAFIRDELMPEIERRYATTAERAIVGESLAGLFVVETFLLEPALFDTYIAFDPSLWWNAGALLTQPLPTELGGRTIYLGNSGEPGLAASTTRMAGRLTAESNARVVWEPMAPEAHATLYHPAALRAFRRLFAPAAE